MIVYSGLNRPVCEFAAGGHTVQDMPYGRTKECARLQDKTQVTKCDFSSLYFPVETCHIVLLSSMSDFLPSDL